jgi:membrane associated rhomboid family serine protease
MFRRKGENLHSIYVFLFLNVAFFFLEYQDAKRFGALFSFERTQFLAGQYWRLFTYQFTVGEGWFIFPKPLILFFTLLILYLMGAAIEEEWGTFHFTMLFAISTVVTAGLAAWLAVPILGSFFVNYTLLFIYASMFPDQTFYLFAIVPIRVRWLAILAACLLGYGAALGGVTNVAVLGGALAAYVYYLLHRVPAQAPRPKAEPEKPAPHASELTAIRNAARFAGMKKALAHDSDAEIDRIVAQCEREIVAGVNICPPADYKPENNDGYCIRCEGFAECSARYLRLNRTQRAEAAPALPEPT